MPEVHADPDKLRQLAKAFAASADELQQVARRMTRALQSSGWDDAERQRFEQDFNQTVKALGQFTQKLKSEYAPNLQRKAAALDQFRR